MKNFKHKCKVRNNRTFVKRKNKNLSNFFIDIGKRIKELRKDAGLTQEQLAEKVDVKSKVTISDWEKGKHLPNAIQLKILSEIGNVSIDYIVAGVKNESLIIKQMKEREAELRKEKGKLEAKYKELKSDLKKVAEKTEEYKHKI